MNSGKYSPFEPLATYRLRNTKRGTIPRPQWYESTNPVSEKPGTVHNKSGDDLNFLNPVSGPDNGVHLTATTPISYQIDILA